jgi:hypothetical protein
MCESRQMLYLRVFTIAVIALLLYSPTVAETRVHPIGLEVTFPDAWDAEFDSDQLFLSESDESAAVMIQVASATDTDAAVDEIMEELVEWIAAPKVTAEGEEGTINGIPATFIEGTGNMEGEPASWLVAFLVFKGKIVIVAGWGETGEWDAEKGDVVDIIRSIQKSES